jgi:hypothetical protein
MNGAGRNERTGPALFARLEDQKTRLHLLLGANHTSLAEGSVSVLLFVVPTAVPLIVWRFLHPQFILNTKRSRDLVCSHIGQLSVLLGGDNAL